MAGLAHGGVADGTRLDVEVGDGLPVGRRVVGTPTGGVGMSAHGRDYRLGYRLGAAPRQQGSLLASSWRPRGRCPVAPARSEAEAAANAHLVVGDVSPDVVEIPTGLTPRAQVLQPRRRITASPVTPIRIPAARRAQRPAHGRPRRASDRHHRAPGISRSWPQNGRIPAQ